MSRTALALSLSLLLVCCTAFRHEPKRAGYQRLIDDHTPAGSRLQTVPVNEAPALVEALYRVRPDRRFVNAAADIVEINTGKAADSVAIEFDGHAWNVSVDGSNAVTLPELVTFRVALGALTRWAAQQRAGSRAVLSKADESAVDADIARFYPRFLFSALRRLDTGKPPDAAASARAAHAAALLAVQANDWFDLSAPLYGRALALLATARSLDGACCADSEALVAYALDYSGEAEQIAGHLPPGFARAYITGETGAPADTAGVWLSIMKRLRNEPLIASREGDKPFSGALDTEAAPLLLQNRYLSYNWPVGAVVQSVVLQSMEAPGTLALDQRGEWQQKFERADAADMLQRFEAKESAIAKARATRLIGEAGILSFYETNWYNALQQQFAVEFNFLGAADGSTRFVASLHPATATGQNVVAWMSNMVDAHFGRFDAARVAPAFDATTLLGGWQRHVLYDEITNAVGPNTPQMFTAATNLFRDLDSRPAETLIAGKLADYPIGHLARRDLYLKSALDRVPGRFAGERTEYYFAIGDREALRRMAADRKAPIADRISALCRMSQITDEDYHTDFEQVYVEAGYTTDRINCYWWYLNGRKQPELKERFAREILKHRNNLNAITEANIVSALGNALEAQGRYAEAWKWVEPRVPVYSANILCTATSLLQRLGRDDEAIALGKEMVERYPEADVRAEFAAVLWRMRRYDDAAELFDPVKHANVIATAQEALPERFAETFSDAEIPEAMAAFEALIKAKAPAALLDRMDSTAYEQKRWPLAFAVMDRYLRVPLSDGWERSTQQKKYAVAYRVLKEMKGPEAAMEWFTARAGGPSQELLVNLLIDGRNELLTDLVVAHPPQDKNVATASVVAAAFSLQRIPLTDARWNIVRQMMPAQPPADDTTIFSSVRCLMGEENPANVAAAADNPTKRSEAGFFLGLRAMSDGDYDRALSDFLVGSQGPPGYATTSMAISRLYMWRGKRQSWRAIAAGHVL